MFYISLSVLYYLVQHIFYYCLSIAFFYSVYYLVEKIIKDTRKNMWAAVLGVDVADGPVASAVQTLVQVSVQGLLLEAWAGPVAFVVQNLVQVSVQGWLLEAWPRPVATKAATATTTATAATTATTRTTTPFATHALVQC